VLATVEPCSEPDRVSFSRLPATTPACPGGAMFPWHSVGGGDRRGDWQRRQPRRNIAPRRQAAWWRGYGLGDAFLVLNIARRRQAPPWRRHLRWLNPSVPIVVGYDDSCPLSHLPPSKFRGRSGVWRWQVLGRVGSPLPLDRPSVRCADCLRGTASRYRIPEMTPLECPVVRLAAGLRSRLSRYRISRNRRHGQVCPRNPVGGTFGRGRRESAAGRHPKRKG
jgi:hypothetical protein